MRFRAYRRTDEAALLELVDADRLVGQPVTTGAMLAEALAGRSAVDGSFWAELDSPVTDVLEDDGLVVGVVSYAVRPSDQVGVILWLHCREDPVVAAALVAHALDRLGARRSGGRAVVAFDFASALSLGLEALPVRHRSVTCEALEAAGFVGEDLWCYMHLVLPVPGLVVAGEVEVRSSEEPGKLELVVLRDGQVLAEATVSEPVGGVGVLWWIAVGQAVRGQGLGTGLLGAALELLVERGAGEVILYVDDDAPGEERDRAAARRLYERVGFREVDRLWSFSRSGGLAGFRG